MVAFSAQLPRYLATIQSTINFLQGHDPTLAHRICSRGFLPEGPRFASLEAYVDDDAGGDPMAWAFGALGSHDRARHLATLYLNDIADVLKDAVDPRFEFVRYGESLAQSQAHFDPLADALAATPNLIDRLLSELTLAAIRQHQPTVVLLSVPFPGAVYAAFRIAQTIKAHDPRIVCALGGGYVNTELRELNEPRVFDYFDYVTLDAGERPLLALLEHLDGRRSASRLVRCFHRDPVHGRTCRYTWLRIGTRCALRRSRHPHLGRPAARAITCRCSTCSTRCTGSGPTAAGTNSPWPTAATGRNAASAM